MMREGGKQEIEWGQYVIGDNIQGLNRKMIEDYIQYLGLSLIHIYPASHLVSHGFFLSVSYSAISI